MSNNTEMTLETLLASLGEPMDKSAEENASSSENKEEVKTSSSIQDELEGLLTKKASQENTSEESTDMNKEAQAKGIAIADAILGVLNKQAEEGSHAVIDQTAALVNEQDAQTEMTPRQGKTVTETLKGIVARGSSAGAVNPDALSDSASTGDETSPLSSLSTSDGHSVNNVPSDLDKEAHEKLAAAQALIAQGHSFEDAVNLVKEAAEELEAEEGEQIKLATIQALVGEGLDVESAVALTKQAMEILAKQASDDEDKDDKKEDKKDKKEMKDEENEKKASIRALINAGFAAEEAVKLVG